MKTLEDLRLDLQKNVTLDELMQDVTMTVAGMLKFYHNSKVGEIIYNPDTDNFNGEDWYYALMIKSGLLEPVSEGIGRITKKFKETYRKLSKEGYYARLEEARLKKMAGR